MCSSGKRKRINAYLEKAREKVNTNGGTNDDLDDADFIIEPEQYPTFGGITVRAPALTRSAQPYSFKHKRVILAEEKLEVMGLPVFVPNISQCTPPSRTSCSHQSSATNMFMA